MLGAVLLSSSEPYESYSILCAIMIPVSAVCTITVVAAAAAAATAVILFYFL